MPGTTSTALRSFSHDQHHKTDAAKWKGGVGSACAVVIRLAPAKPCAHCRAGCWATSVQSVEHDLTAIYKSVWLTAGDQRPWRAQQTHPPSCVGDINN